MKKEIRWPEAECDATVSISGTKKSPESETIVEGWAIRWQDGDLTLFQQQPIRLISKDEYPVGWTSRDGCRFFLPKDKLPFVTYENSPKKVKITITPIEE